MNELKQQKTYDERIKEAELEVSYFVGAIEELKAKMLASAPGSTEYKKARMDYMLYRRNLYFAKMRLIGAKEAEEREGRWKRVSPKKL